MTTLTKENQSLLTNQLAKALVKFSENRISYLKAEEVANVVMKKVDFSNSALSHKGINWFAKDLIKQFRI
ncbi:hypothetical protein [Paenibacillus illinoisensis]|uniref:Uncharacterized protein n=1 Tax=Paenibacillus illinoisensis TaxID=59845 RepID=A0A2W0C7F3_9BACL|nr:hypothetical protein [Paenibacillus illinoisensis]PYY28376.1 Uncharacterized protein PIL02S_03532 [Paenibacillus illinoisensis]